MKRERRFYRRIGSNVGCSYEKIICIFLQCLIYWIYISCTLSIKNSLVSPPFLLYFSSEIWLLYMLEVRFIKKSYLIRMMVSQSHISSKLQIIKNHLIVPKRKQTQIQLRKYVMMILHSIYLRWQFHSILKKEKNGYFRLHIPISNTIPDQKTISSDTYLLER